jgi:hypothetical protein
MVGTVLVPPLPVRIAIVLFGIRPDRWRAWNESLVESSTWPVIGAMRRGLGVTTGAVITCLVVGESYYYPMAVMCIACLAYVIPAGMLLDAQPRSRRVAIARIRGTWRPGRAERAFSIVLVLWSVVTLWDAREGRDHSATPWQPLALTLNIFVIVMLGAAYRERKRQERQLGL